MVEPDDCYVSAAETGVPYCEPDNPPRQAIRRRGHGTFDNDRLSVAATIDHETGRARLMVIRNSDRRTLEALVEATTMPGVTVNIDEWRAYAHLPDLGRGHATVNYGAGEWAHDYDGDGVR